MITFTNKITVDIVQSNASDSVVVNAARVSTRGTHVDPDIGPDKGLINYLIRERHGSPFEHATFTFFIHAPIFVIREFMRHRAGWSYNEESARYRQLEPVFYVPNRTRNLVQSGKPGHYEFSAGSDEQFNVVGESHRAAYKVAYDSYVNMLEAGVAREVARSVLPVGIYSSMFATCNSRSLMHFLSLRMHDTSAAYVSHPQHEIEQVAIGMQRHLQDRMPRTYYAYVEHGRVSP